MRAPLFGHLWFPALLVTTLAVTLVGCGGNAATPGSTTPGLQSGNPPVQKGPTSPESDKVTWKKDAAPKSCHTGNKGDGDLSAGVLAMAGACVDKKMKQVGAVLTGEGGGAAAGTPGGMIKQFPLKAQANHCYRVLGLAQASVTDFDIAIVDSAVKNCGEDLTDGNDAVVLEDGVVCFKVDDDVNINAAVGAGSGKWALVVFSD
jgi:hypothetical protein